MKIISVMLLTFCLTSTAQNQNSYKVTINKTVYFDSAAVVSVEQQDLKAPPPLDSDFSIVDDKWVNAIMNGWEYWDEAFVGHQTTLFIFKNGKTAADSVLVAENANNHFTFKKVGAKWPVENFTIKATNITLNHVACGQTSTEVFKLLNKKVKKRVGDGVVFVSNKDGSYVFILTFVQDKLVSIKL